MSHGTTDPHRQGNPVSVTWPLLGSPALPRCAFAMQETSKQQRSGVTRCLVYLCTISIMCCLFTLVALQLYFTYYSCWLACWLLSWPTHIRGIKLTPTLLCWALVWFLTKCRSLRRTGRGRSQSPGMVASGGLVLWYLESLHVYAEKCPCTLLFMSCCI